MVAAGPGSEQVSLAWLRPQVLNLPSPTHPPDTQETQELQAQKGSPLSRG